MSQQGYRQASARVISGSAGTYNEDITKAAATVVTLPTGAGGNEALLLLMNARLAKTYTSLPEALQAYAASKGAYNWSSVGTVAA